MAIDVSKIPNKKPFDDIRDNLVDLENQVNNIDTSGGGGGTLNNLEGDVTLVGGTDINISSNGTDQLTINSTAVTTPIVSIGQYTSTDTTTNINNATATILPFNSIDTNVTDTSNYALSGGRVTITEAGKYWVYVNIFFTDAGGTNQPQRANPAVEIYLNGTSLGYRGGMGYLRNASGHDEAGNTIACYVDVSANDIIDARTIRIADSEALYLDANRSVLAISKVGGAVSGGGGGGSYTVTEQDVTQYEGALSITESQITDLQSYLTSVPAEFLTQTEGDNRYLQNIPSEYLTETEGDNRYALSSALPTNQEEQNWNNAYNNIVDSASFNTTTGDLTIGRSNSNDLTIPFDGRYLTTHPAVANASNTSNTGRTYIQNLTFDSFGHVTGVSSATETSTGGVSSIESLTGAVDLVAGSNVTISTDTNLNKITISASNSGTGTELDPVFAASVASGIQTADIDNWNTAYGWGDHSAQNYTTLTEVGNQGYLTSFTESDPTVPTHVKNISTTSISQWSTAYSWGDHATAGYLSSFTESDPTVPTHVKNITTSNISNWNTAYNWGDHSTEGYLTSFNEIDPTVPSHVKTITTSNISNWNTAYNWGDHSAQGYLTSFTESDPTVPTYVKQITQSNISNWNTAYSWGDHAGEGYLTSYTETDPTVPAHVKSITTTDISQWDTAYGWGDHSTQGYLTSEVNDLTDSVTWANVPDANITQSSVRQHIDKTYIDGLSIDADTLDGEDGEYYLNYANFFGNYSIDYDNNGTKIARGIIYYVGSQTNIDDVPNPTGTFNFVTNKLTFTANGSSWSESPPDSASTQNKVFLIEWNSYNAYVGTSTARPANFGSPFESTQFNGPVTFTALKTADASVINGSNITTGSIQSTGFQVGSGGFSNQGTRINLLDGSIEAEQFQIDTNGNASFKGTLDVADGTFRVDSANKIVTTENVTIDGQTISLTSSSVANIGEINFIQDGTGEVASIQNFSGTNITNPQFKIETKTNGGQLYFRGAESGGATDFHESIRMASVKDMSIKSRCSLIGGTLTYHVDDTLNGTNDSATLVSLTTASIAANKSLIIEITASCDTHAVFAVFGCRANSTGSWDMVRRVHTGDTGNLDIEETGSNTNTIRMQNKTASFSLPANAVIRISGSASLMRYDRLEQILSFSGVNRALFETT